MKLAVGLLLSLFAMNSHAHTLRCGIELEQEEVYYANVHRGNSSFRGLFEYDGAHVTECYENGEKVEVGIYPDGRRRAVVLVFNLFAK